MKKLHQMIIGIVALCLRKECAFWQLPRKKRILLCSPAVLLLLFVLVTSYFLFAPISDSRCPITIEISDGDSLQKTVTAMEKEGLVKNKPSFYAYAYLRGLSRKIKPGEYEFSATMSQAKIISMLARGITKIYVVTIPEDWSVQQIAARLAERKLVDYDVFMKFAANTTFLKEMNIEADSAEGYLFPETYSFERPMGEKKIMKIMVNQFWHEFTPQLVLRAHELGFSITEAVTLASLIGKEARVGSERQLISAVFHNRLRGGMKLQSDPTAVYRFNSRKVIVTKADLQKKSKHNTYLIAGLPKGPIANPGKDSLVAALNPASVDYLYFVANKNGSHFFSYNYKEHVSAIKRLYKKRHIDGKQKEVNNDNDN